MSQIIRPLILGDLTALEMLLRQLAVESLNSIGGHWSGQMLAQELNQGAGLGIFTGENLLSFLLFRHHVDHVDITFIMSAPNHRQQGAGRALIEELTRRSGGLPLFVEVHEENLGAQKFYGQMGFREVGRRPRYYAGKSTAIIMTST